MKLGTRIVVFIGMLGIVLTFLGAKDVINMSKDTINMDTADWGTLKAGDHVSITIDMVWGQFYYETQEQSTLGVVTNSTETARGYAIPHLFINGDGYYDIDYYIGLRLMRPEDYRIIEQILEESDAWYYDTTGTVDYGMTTMHIDGTLEKMDGEEKQLMEEYLLDCGYTQSEIDQIVCPYMINRGNSKASGITLGIGIFFDALCLVILGILFFSHRKEKNTYTYMGVAQTGSYDIYGGPDYGGSNYGASNKSKPTYDGSEYGDTSYGGTNTYGQTGSYGGSNSYGQSGSYGGSSSYGQTGSYGGSSSYGQTGSYGGSSSYGQTESYGRIETYGQGGTFSAADLFGQSSVAESTGAYGATDTYGQSNVAESSSANESAAASTTEWPWHPKF